MREILFRGKRMDNGEWVEGLLFVGFGKTYICPEPTAMYCFDGALCLGGFIEVDPDTVGQYTGLTDKNGRKIFEGDVLKDDWGEVYEVFFTTKSCSFMVECTKTPNEREPGNYRIGEAWCGTIQVIGNIHDDPELLDQ